MGIHSLYRLSLHHSSLLSRQEDEAWSDSGDEGFRMFAGQEGERLWMAVACSVQSFTMSC